VVTVCDDPVERRPSVVDGRPDHPGPVATLSGRKAPDAEPGGPCVDVGRRGETHAAARILPGPFAVVTTGRALPLEEDEHLTVLAGVEDRAGVLHQEPLAIRRSAAARDGPDEVVPTRSLGEARPGRQRDEQDG
jgi:hypothetical protein